MSNKVGLGVVLAIAIIGLLQTSVIPNALLSFAAAGVVPGTNMVLSPNATLWVLGAVLAISVLLIFRNNLQHVLSRPAGLPAEEAAVDVEVTAEPSKPRRSFKIHLNLVLFESFSRTLGAAINRLFWIAVYRGDLIWMKMRPRVMRAKIFIEVNGLKALRWCRSRLVQFDTWATTEIKKRDTLNMLMIFLHECAQVLTKWRVEARVLAARHKIRFF